MLKKLSTGLNRIVANAAKVKGNKAGPWFDRVPFSVLRSHPINGLLVLMDGFISPRLLLFHALHDHD